MFACFGAKCSFYQVSIALYAIAVFKKILIIFSNRSPCLLDCCRVLAAVILYSWSLYTRMKIHLQSNQKNNQRLTGADFCDGTVFKLTLFFPFLMTLRELLHLHVWLCGTASDSNSSPISSVHLKLNCEKFGYGSRLYVAYFFFPPVIHSKSPRLNR